MRAVSTAVSPMRLRIRPLSSLFAAAAAALLPGVLPAQTSVSLSTSGNWSLAGNWNPGVVPNNSGPNLYNATVAGGRTATLDIDVSIQNLSIAGVASPGAFSTVTLNPGRTLTVNGFLSAGLYTRFNGGGSLVLTGGGSSAGNALLTLDGVTFNNQAGSVFSDNAANGAFSTVLANGGTINNAGTYSLDGASCGIYASGTGTSFNNSGTFRGSGNTTVPFSNTGAISSLGQLSFGAGGTSSGTLSTGANINQSVTFTSGAWNFTAASVNSGAGVFRVAGATVTINGAHNVSGSTQVGSGSLTFANAGTTLGGILYLYGGTTSFTGANAVSRLDLGNPAFASGSPSATLNLGANGALAVNGAFNTGTYSQVNGTGTAAITLNGGGTVGANSAFILSGVTLTNTPGSTITQANAGGFDNTLQNGAVINNAGTWLLQNQNGRGLVAPGAAGAGAAFNNTGTLWANVSYTSANIGFALNNTGTFRLDAGAGGGGNPSVAVGTFTQTAGSTQLAHDNGNFATLSSSNPLHFQGGSLLGSGRLLGNVFVSGAGTLVSPGFSLGTISVQGAYQQTGGMLALEIGRTAGGAVNDRLTGNGVLSLTGAAVTFSLLPGSLPLQVGDAFTVLSSSGNGLALTGDTFTFDPSLSGYTFSQAQTTAGYTLTVTGAVPEPSTWLLLGTGGLALLAARITRKAR